MKHHAKFILLHYQDISLISGKMHRHSKKILIGSITFCPKTVSHQKQKHVKLQIISSPLKDGNNFVADTSILFSGNSPFLGNVFFQCYHGLFSRLSLIDLLGFFCCKVFLA